MYTSVFLHFSSSPISTSFTISLFSSILVSASRAFFFSTSSSLAFSSSRIFCLTLSISSSLCTLLSFNLAISTFLNASSSLSFSAFSLLLFNASSSLSFSSFSSIVNVLIKSSPPPPIFPSILAVSSLSLTIKIARFTFSTTGTSWKSCKDLLLPNSSPLLRRTSS